MPPGEASGPAPIDTQSKPGFGDILKQAGEAGQKTRAEAFKPASEVKAGFFSAITKARETAKSAWNGAREIGSKIGKTVDVALGVASSSEVRAALGGYVEGRAIDAKDALKARAEEIREAAINRKDEAVEGFKKRVGNLWNTANEKL